MKPAGSVPKARGASASSGPRPTSRGPVCVICGNARCDQTKGLSAWLDGQRLVQALPPPYAPTLHLVERFWKFLRQKITGAAFYRTKGQPKTAAPNVFGRLDELGPERAFLLTRKFHVIDSQPAS
ncbi:MAG: hypothetical protein WKG07_12050 [Hymenobacter sp.]